MIFFTITMINKISNKEITKTWISGPSSCTLVIPKSIASRYGLSTPSHVIIEAQNDGILIRKLEV